MILKLKKNNVLKEAVTGFSWTTFFFGLCVPICRGDIKWGAIMAVLALVTGGLSWLVFPFVYNKLYIKECLKDGFEAADDMSKNYLLGNQYIVE